MNEQYPTIAAEIHQRGSLTVILAYGEYTAYILDAGGDMLDGLSGEAATVGEAIQILDAKLSQRPPEQSLTELLAQRQVRHS